MLLYTKRLTNFAAVACRNTNSCARYNVAHRSPRGGQLLELESGTGSCSAGYTDPNLGSRHRTLDARFIPIISPDTAENRLTPHS